MKHKFDWHYLRSAIIIISATVIATILLAYFSHAYRAEVEASYELEQASYRDLEKWFRDVNEDKHFIEIYSERFKELEAEGVFVAEQRVDWVDGLQTAIREMKLPNVKYEVSPKGLSTDYSLLAADSILIYASPLKIEMNLLHERDMIMLLDRLERKVMGRFLVDRCEMRRAELKFGYYLDRPNLGVTCHLRWLTMSPADSAAGADV